MFESMSENWLWCMIILPVMIGLFKAEIGKLFTVWNIYRLRAFDLDGDPNTKDNVEVLCGATGAWRKVIIEKYVWSLSTARRGVYLKYPNGTKEKVSFLVWATLRKRTYSYK